MRHVAWFLLAALVCASAAPAQLGRDRVAELQRAKRKQENKALEIERLVDRRYRLDLGLPLAEDTTLRRDLPLSTAERERKLHELDEIESATSTYVARYNKVKNALADLRTEIEAQEAAKRASKSFVDVPSMGAPQPNEPASAASSAQQERSPRERDPVAAEPGPVPLELDPAVRIDRVRGWIHGSEDHLRVAHSLLKAGQKAMDLAERARGQDDLGLAKDFDARGKDRLERALVELEPLLETEAPDYGALFCRGRCLELLFRYSVRYEDLSLDRSTKLFQQREQDVRQPFLAIAARDVSHGGGAGAIETLGPWGRAAQAAVEHFRWMNLHANYAPSTPIEALTWPGEKNK